MPENIPNSRFDKQNYNMNVERVKFKRIYMYTGNCFVKNFATFKM